MADYDSPLLRCPVEILVQIANSGTSLKGRLRFGQIDRYLFEILIFYADWDCVAKDGSTVMHAIGAVPDRWYRLWPRARQQGLGVNEINIHGETPLHHAVKDGSHMHTMVEKFIAKGAHLEKTDKTGRTPLGMALVAKNLRVANILVEKGACPGDISVERMTPLRCALESRDVRVVHWILPDANTLHAPLHMLAVFRGACSFSSSSVIESMLERYTISPGLEAVVPNITQGLQDAVLYGNADVIELLKDYGGDVKQVDITKRNLITQILVKEDIKDAVKTATALAIITATGQDSAPHFDRPDIWGKCCVHYALQLGLSEVAIRLSSTGIKTHSSPEGSTLLLAARNGLVNAFRALLKSGTVRPGDCTTHAPSLLHAIARRNYQPEIKYDLIDCACEYGADFVLDEDGTALRDSTALPESIRDLLRHWEIKRHRERLDRAGPLSPRYNLRGRSQSHLLGNTIKSTPKSREEHSTGPTEVAPSILANVKVSRRKTKEADGQDHETAKGDNARVRNRKRAKTIMNGMTDTRKSPPKEKAVAGIGMRISERLKERALRKKDGEGH